jgi:hypothetical protein
MDKPKYKSVRLLYETYTLLKIEAAKRDIPMAELLDVAVKRETAKTGGVAAVHDSSEDFE